MATTIRRGASVVSEAVERSEPDEDGLYPVAPLPAHERIWRHPSEIGAATWASTEPPLALGRGLAMAVSVIGGLLTVTVLWAVLSTNAGTSSSATVAPKGEPSGLLHWVLPKPGEATSTRSAGTSAATITRSSSAPSTAAPTAAQVVAVSVGHAGTLALTTSAAITGRTEVAVNRLDGSTVVGQVLFADLDGIAVLRFDDPSSSAGLGLGPRPEVGNAVQVGRRGESAVVDQRLVNTFHITQTCPTAGSPVVDLDGRLIGLCESAGDGHVRDIQFVRALQDTLAELTP